ncbi:MAG: hypothetical protein AAFO76_14940, partial [Cyanobacteria bacterium J06607_15]
LRFCSYRKNQTARANSLELCSRSRNLASNQYLFLPGLSDKIAQLSASASYARNINTIAHQTT